MSFRFDVDGGGIYRGNSDDVGDKGRESWRQG